MYIIFTTLVVLIMFLLIKKCLKKFLKEDLNLNTYATIYVNTIQSAYDNTFGKALNSCTNINTNTEQISTIVTNTINSITYPSEEILINNKIDSLKNTGSPFATKTTLLNVQNIFNIATSNNNNYNKYFSDIKDYLAPNYIYRYTLSPTLSDLNNKILSSFIELNKYYFTTKNSYDTATTNVNILIKDITDLTTNYTTLNESYNAKLLPARNTLNTILNNINTQLSLLSTSKILAQNSLNVINNSYAIQDVIKLLDTIYINASTNLNIATKNKNDTYIALQNGIINKVSSSQLAVLQTNYNNADEAYKQSYVTLQFLLNPTNLVTNINMNDEIINLNTNNNKGNKLSPFLLYLRNNVNETRMNTLFSNLYDILNNSLNSLTNVNNNVTNVFNQIINIVRNKNSTASNNAINLCNSSEKTLNAFFKSVNDNIVRINNIKTQLTNTYNFILNTNNTIAVYNNNLININKNLRNIPLYKSEVFYLTSSYDNYGGRNGIFTSFGTIQNSGKIVKIYLFLNIYFYGCFTPILEFAVMNSNNTLTAFTKVFDMSNYSGYCALQYSEKFINPIRVYSGYTVNIKIRGGFTCIIRTSNVQAQLEIDQTI